MYKHRVFYETPGNAESALLWIIDHIEDVEDEDTSEASDGANDECFFKTTRKISDYDQGWIVRATKATSYSFNGEDYKSWEPLFTEENKDQNLHCLTSMERFTALMGLVLSQSNQRPMNMPCQPTWNTSG